MNNNNNSLMVSNNLVEAFGKINVIESKVMINIFSKATLNNRIKKQIQLDTRLIKDIVADKNYSIKKLEDTFKKFNNVVNIFRDEENEISDNIVLLERYKFDKEQCTFTLTESICKYLNRPEKRFALLLMLEASQLKNKYAYKLYLQCAIWAFRGGYKYNNLDDFKNALDIPKVYKVAEISRTILKKKKTKKGEPEEYEIEDEINNNTRFNIKIEPIKRGKQQIKGFELKIDTKIESIKSYDILRYLNGSKEKAEEVAEVEPNNVTEPQKSKEVKEAKTKAPESSDIYLETLKEIGSIYKTKLKKPVSYSNISITKRKNIYKNKEEIIKAIEVYSKDKELKINGGFKATKAWTTFLNNYESILEESEATKENEESKNQEKSIWRSIIQ